MARARTSTGSRRQASLRQAAATRSRPRGWRSSPSAHTRSGAASHSRRCSAECGSRTRLRRAAGRPSPSRRARRSVRGSCGSISSRRVTCPRATSTERSMRTPSSLLARALRRACAARRAQRSPPTLHTHSGSRRCACRHGCHSRSSGASAEIRTAAFAAHAPNRPWRPSRCGQRPRCGARIVGPRRARVERRLRG